MTNLAELSIKDLKELIYSFYPKMSEEDIYNTPLSLLREMVEEEFERQEMLEEAEEEVSVFTVSLKHSPSRKKKANRLKRKTVTYNKVKKGNNRVKYTRRRVEKEETTNRSYMNKASKAYIPDRKLY